MLINVLFWQNIIILLFSDTKVFINRIEKRSISKEFVMNYTKSFLK